jgi:hypothetical protein
MLGEGGPAGAGLPATPRIARDPRAAREGARSRRASKVVGTARLAVAKGVQTVTEGAQVKD